MLYRSVSVILIYVGFQPRLSLVDYIINGLECEDMGSTSCQVCQVDYKNHKPLKQQDLLVARERVNASEGINNCIAIWSLGA